MGKQAVLRFCMSLRETFSTSVSFAEINKYGKGASVQLLIVFRPVYHVRCQKVV